MFGGQLDVRFEEEGRVQGAFRILACGWWIYFLPGQKYQGRSSFDNSDFNSE